MNTSYTAITPPSILEELKAIVGGESNLCTDIERIENYSHDETSKEQFSHMPEVVLTPPVSTEQISEVMKLADRYTIPVTPPRGGAGSGLSGGAIPIHGGGSYFRLRR